jgi:hypothetical protein
VPKVEVSGVTVYGRMLSQNGKLYRMTLCLKDVQIDNRLKFIFKVMIVNIRSNSTGTSVFNASLPVWGECMIPSSTSLQMRLTIATT